MSLATRCSACGTVFRVVQDQLKVSEGWVRCGRCQEVFNAVEGLFDLDREAPPAWPQAMQPSEPAHAAPMPQAPELRSADLQARPLLRTEDSESPDDFADARFHSELLADADAPPAQSRAAGVDAGADTVPPAGPEPAPHFVRAAERAARWQQPQALLGMGLAGLILAVVLAGQVAVHFRVDIAARWPQARPLLEAWCAAAGCRLDAPRRLEQLAVDSSGLVRLDANGLYRLEVVLHNRASHDVMLPALDLTLTDAAGRVVTRKVVRPADLGATRDAIAAGADLPLHALLATGDARISGYTVDLFDP
jgi:predicted Zn finger-like uncharacterized protein